MSYAHHGIDPRPMCRLFGGTPNALKATRSPRQWLLAVAVGACILTPSGCSTVPDVAPTLDLIDKELELLKKMRQEAIKNCNGDQACIDHVNERFDELEDKALLLRQKVIDEQWQDARKAKEDLREIIKQLIPEFPDLRDLLEELLRALDKEVGELDMSGTVVSIGSVGGGNADASPAMSLTYAVAGTLDAPNWIISDTISVSGNLHVVGTQNGSGFSGTVDSGSFTIQLPDNTVVDADIYAGNIVELASTLQSDSNGEGWIDLYLSLDDAFLDANPQWGVFFDVTTRVRLPVTMSSNHNLTASYGPATFGDMIPYRPWPASDYDDNGVLEAQPDSAAFLLGFSLQEALADSNFDEAWTFPDVQLWQQRFAEDATHD